MIQIVGPETMVFNLNQTPGNYPKEDNLNTVNHDESLKFNISHFIAIYLQESLELSLCRLSGKTGSVKCILFVVL
jgi:hypothetical protein